MFVALRHLDQVRAIRSAFLSVRRLEPTVLAQLHHDLDPSLLPDLQRWE